RTQRLYKYDSEKVSGLQNFNSQITSYYSAKGVLPNNAEEMASVDYYYGPALVDPQSQKPYEYKKTSDTTYELCAEFNKASDDKMSKMSQTYPYTMDSYGGGAPISWTHPAGHHCF